MKKCFIFTGLKLDKMGGFDIRSERIPERSWERTVAAAAPPTPIPHGTMKTISRTTFRSDEMIRYISGRRLSPNALSMLDMRL